MQKTRSRFLQNYLWFRSLLWRRRQTLVSLKMSMEIYDLVNSDQLFYIHIISITRHCMRHNAFHIYSNQLICCRMLLSDFPTTTTYFWSQLLKWANFTNHANTLLWLQIIWNALIQMTVFNDICITHSKLSIKIVWRFWMIQLNKCMS